MSKFRIIRKDLNLDPGVLETEGLTIGRLVGNDLTLNHPTVSRTHAGLKEIGGDYWIFNLSEANGTLLNGEQIEQTPLADGDLIQIGAFTLFPKYQDDCLQLEIEMQVRPTPVEASGGSQQIMPLDQRKTVRLDLAALAQLQRGKTTPRGTRRLVGSGLLTGGLTPQDEQALKIFWDKRKREAGKIGGDSPLKPKGKRRLGKAQFNWSPTRDLQFPWPKPLFVWGTLVVTVLAVASVFAFKEAYSPGPLSNPHSRKDMGMSPAIAKEINGSTCTACHTIKTSMNQSCATCHTTTAFSSNVSDKHMQLNMTCTACHTEHNGREFRPAFVANIACTGCHRDGSGFVSPFNNQPLKTPHGGTLGYPVTDGRWTWAGISQTEWKRKQLPGIPAQFVLKEQFHLIHLAGRQQGRSYCTDCHTGGFEGEAVRQGVRESCAACHGVDPAIAGAQILNANIGFSDRGQRKGNTAAGGPLCVSCHSQHGEEKELRTSLRRNVRLTPTPTP
jgi:pSer/pThr/pTyr-binding forkhead associated (FHA) protein